MKKNILIACSVIVTFSLMAFSFINKSEPIDSTTTLEEKEEMKEITYNCSEPTLTSYLTTTNSEIDYSNFYYKVGPRFDAIKKSDVESVTSVKGFHTKEEMKQIVSYESTAVILIVNEQQSPIREYGDSEKLNNEQLELLKSLDYSSHFLMRTEFLTKNKETGELEFKHYGPHLTVVPEKQATYSLGKKALLEYIRINNKENTANLNEDRLKFAEVSFTITKEGKITNVSLDRSSGYVHIDMKMKDLISNTPGIWEPAENVDGEKVDQNLIVSFGLDNGC